MGFKKEYTPWNKGKSSWNKGLTKQTDKRVKKQSEYMIGINNPMYGKQSPMKGKHHTDMAKEKNRQAHIGKKPWNKGLEGFGVGRIVSQETRSKISRANKGRKPLNPPWNKGRILPRGWHHTQETKDKISKVSKGRKHTDETKQKMSIAHKGKPGYWKNKKMSEESKQKIREHRAKQKFPFKDTTPERFIESILTLNGIKFEKHKPIKFSTGSYHQVDFFLTPNICIEVDGDYWHNTSDGKKRDIIINKELMSLGYDIYRIWEHEIMQNCGYYK
jgi:very-short-patch-repair endonuclease